VNFLITGLPRSRTAWLANFLTYGGAFCFHEAIRFCKSIEDFRRVTKLPQYKVIGDSDCGALPFVPEIKALFPDLRLLVVRRDAKDAYMDARINLGFRVNENLVEANRRMMENVIDKHSPKVVEFDDLDMEDTCREVWDYCVPGVAFDPIRWRMLDGLRMEILPEKYAKTVTGLHESDLATEAVRRMTALLDARQEV